MAQAPIEELFVLAQIIIINRLILLLLLLLLLLTSIYDMYFRRSFNHNYRLVFVGFTRYVREEAFIVRVLPLQ